MRNTEKAITLKLGGSEATSAEGANYEYLYSFIDQIANTLNTFDKIGLIIGGGPRIRVLQKTVDTDYEKDMIAREAMWGHAETLSEVASNLGFEKIVLVGQDLAYDGEFSHAGGISEKFEGVVDFEIDRNFTQFYKRSQFQVSFNTLVNE